MLPGGGVGVTCVVVVIGGFVRSVEFVGVTVMVTFVLMSLVLVSVKVRVTFVLTSLVLVGGTVIVVVLYGNFVNVVKYVFVMDGNSGIAHGCFLIYFFMFILYKQTAGCLKQ